MPAMRVHTLMPPRDHAHTRPQKDRLICMAETPRLHPPNSDSLNQEKTGFRLQMTPLSKMSSKFWNFKAEF